MTFAGRRIRTLTARALRPCVIALGDHRHGSLEAQSAAMLRGDGSTVASGHPVLGTPVCLWGPTPSCVTPVRPVEPKKAPISNFHFHPCLSELELKPASIAATTFPVATVFLHPGRLFLHLHYESTFSSPSMRCLLVQSCLDYPALAAGVNVL